VARLWHSIADPLSKKHKEFGCLIKEIKSYREACSYMSKYIAKDSIENDSDVEGKHWGNSRNLPIKIRKRIGGFDEDAHLLIKKLLSWMRENGKEKYANDDFLNIHNDFVVFINRNDFENIIKDDEFFFRDY